MSFLLCLGITALILIVALGLLLGFLMLLIHLTENDGGPPI